MVKLLSLLLLLISSSTISFAPTPINIGVILDLDTPAGKTSKSSLTLALSDFLSSHPNSSTSLNLLFRHSQQHDIVTAATATLIANQGVIALILGPHTSSPASSFIANIAANCQVPVIPFTSASTTLSPYFIPASFASSASAQPIASLVKSFGWRRVVPIYEDSDFGTSFLPSLVEALDNVGSQIPYRVFIPVSASDSHIQAEL